MENLPAFDEKRFHFGFLLGLNSADFIMEHDLSRLDSLLVLESQSQGGFNLGIITDLHLHPNLNLRFVPQLAFGQRNLEYTFLDLDSARRTTVKPIESTWLDFPLGFKFRSARLNNFAAYIYVGGKYSLDLASQEDVDQGFTEDIIIKIRKNSYSYEVGFGMDFFLPYFKFSPEIKLGMGVGNIHVQDNSLFSTPIDRLVSRMMVISLNFEG